MPLITIELASKSLDKNQKERLYREMTDLMHDITGIRKEAFLIYLHENSTDNVGSGGIMLSEKL
jgi:4-oxalocrotonate tautomerase